MVEIKISKDELKEAFKSEDTLHDFIYEELYNRVVRAILNDNSEEEVPHEHHIIS